MFQSFKSKKSRHASKSCLADLRKSMRAQNADWFLVPHSDEHQNEYLPESAERLAFLTGFTGSAGFAIIGQTNAYLFVDGRYTVQAANEVDQSLFKIVDLVTSPPASYAKSIISNDEIVAYDPWLITIGQKKIWEKTTKACGAKFIASDNLIDQIWKEQPSQPSGRAWLHPVEYAGLSAEKKLEQIRKKLVEDDADYLLQTDPASLAWTFNLRGNDLVHNPLSLGWALIPTNPEHKPLIFIDAKKFNQEDRKALETIAELLPPEALEEVLAKHSPQAKIHCDPALVASALGEIITANGGETNLKRDPVVILRAVKNNTELSGARNAHIRDGVAMVKFLAWLDAETAGNENANVDEISAAKMLETLRASNAKEMNSELMEISFDTISGAGANGAIVHYRVTEDTNAPLKPDSLYLVDSGAQYLDGTTDITRTVAIGTPPKQAIHDNTLVLKGHIAIALARFPKGTRGVDIDGLARIALWQSGKDFAHGTGHGIGSFLNVHEGPQSISRRGLEAFQPGMIVSNEPGYYKEGEYGIRIENLLIVTPEDEISGGDKPMLGFETITLCPIDLQLIDKTMMTQSELDWLNAYHSRVATTLGPHLSGEPLDWLTQATRPL